MRTVQDETSIVTVLAPSGMTTSNVRSPLLQGIAGAPWICQLDSTE